MILPIRNRYSNTSYALKFGVDIGKEDWYEELCRDIGCDQIELVDGTPIKGMIREKLCAYPEFFSRFNEDSSDPTTPLVLPYKYNQKTSYVLEEWYKATTQAIISETVEQIANKYRSRSKLLQTFDSSNENSTLFIQSIVEQAVAKSQKDLKIELVDHESLRDFRLYNMIENKFVRDREKLHKSHTEIFDASSLSIIIDQLMTEYGIEVEGDSRKYVASRLNKTIGKEIIRWFTSSINEYGDWLKETKFENAALSGNINNRSVTSEQAKEYLRLSLIRHIVSKSDNPLDEAYHVLVHRKTKREIASDEKRARILEERDLKNKLSKQLFAERLKRADIKKAYEYAEMYESSKDKAHDILYILILPEGEPFNGSDHFIKNTDAVVAPSVETTQSIDKGKSEQLSMEESRERMERARENEKKLKRVVRDWLSGGNQNLLVPAAKSASGAVVGIDKKNDDDDDHETYVDNPDGHLRGVPPLPFVMRPSSQSSNGIDVRHEVTVDAKLVTYRTIGSVEDGNIPIVRKGGYLHRYVPPGWKKIQFLIEKQSN